MNRLIVFGARLNHSVCIRAERSFICTQITSVLVTPVVVPEPTLLTKLLHLVTPQVTPSTYIRVCTGDYLCSLAVAAHNQASPNAVPIQHCHTHKLILNANPHQEP